MQAMRWLFPLAFVASAGCAKANVGTPNPGDDDDDNPQIDAPDNPQIDAPDVTPIDSPPPPVDGLVSETLQQTQNTTIAAANSVACGNQTTGTTSENSWYRVFALADHNITGPFTVSQVTIAIQESAGSPAAQIKIGTYTGTIGANTLDLSKVTALNAQTVTIPPTTTGVSVPVAINATIPANAQFIVELFAPDLSTTAGNHIYIGATTSAETANRPSYIRAPACSINTPQTVAMTGFPNAHAIITVTGTH
jgi:hypothetical protein